MIIKVIHCKQADEDHKISKRQYAHVGHRSWNKICVAKAFFALPRKIRLGLLLHELGHIFGADGEKESDDLAYKIFGIKIKRINTKYGNNLESI